MKIHFLYIFFCVSYTSFCLNILRHINKPPSCKVYLVRHGQTDWNIQGKLQGHSNIPLNEQGRKDAFAAQEKLKHISFAAIFSSDLIRAYETAQIITQGKQEIIQTSLLRERSFGSLEGKSSQLIIENCQERLSKIVTKQDYMQFQVQVDTESYEHAFNRVNTFFKSLIPYFLNTNVLVVTHGGLMASIMYALDYKPNHQYKFSNGAMLKLLLDEKGAISIAQTEGATLIEGFFP